MVELACAPGEPTDAERHPQTLTAFEVDAGARIHRRLRHHTLQVPLSSYNDVLVPFIKLGINWISLFDIAPFNFAVHTDY